MTKAEINNRFTYHKPIGTQPQRYEAIRNKAKELALTINSLCPESREKSLAMTHLEEGVMQANAAIARNEDEGNCNVPLPGMSIEESAAWTAGYQAAHDVAAKQTTPCCERDGDKDGNCDQHKFSSKKVVTRAALDEMREDLLTLCNLIETQMPASELATKMVTLASGTAHQLQSFLYTVK